MTKKTEVKALQDQLQKWLNKHVDVLRFDNKSAEVLKTSLHKSVIEKVTSSVEPQATTELRRKDKC